jgi:hypothetical protein
MGTGFGKIEGGGTEGEETEDKGTMKITVLR